MPPTLIKRTKPASDEPETTKKKKLLKTWYEVLDKDGNVDYVSNNIF